MKTLRIIFSTITVTIFCFSLVFFSACKKKDVKYNETAGVLACKNVTCLNGGTCLDGQCLCVNGYEGTNCELRWNTKFIGNYQAQDECYASTGSPYYNVSIAPVVEFANKIELYNLGIACPTKIVTATINPEKTSFTIPLQNTCGDIYISGTGNISQNEINIYLINRDTVAHTSQACSILLHKL